MNDPKFTPGPWRATSTGMSRFVDATIRPGVAQEVAWCGVTEAPEQMDANARLIAAAPELFEALAKMVERIEFYTSLREAAQTNIEQWEYTDGSTDMKKAREALAKARGVA